MEFLTHMQAQYDQLEQEKSALNPNSPDDKWQIQQIEIKQAAIKEQMTELESQQAAAQLKIQQDHEERVVQSITDFNNKIENLDISNGMTLRDVIIDEMFYQSLTIAIKGMFQAEVDSLSKQIADLQTENADVNARYAKANTDLQTVTNQLNQEKLEHTYTAQSRDNAAALLEEANQTIEQLKEQLKNATQGVKVTNTEEEQRLKEEADAKIKRERTIYNPVPDNVLNTKSYTANLAATGELFTFPHYAFKSYIVIHESEVSQFRESLGITETAPTTTDNADDTAVVTTDGVEQASQFPEIPTATAPEVPSVSDTVDQGQPSVEVAGETLEARVAALEAHVFGYVKGAVA